MGVKNLFPFLKRVVPQCIKQVSMEELRGKKIVIDGHLLLYREYTSPWLPISQPKKYVLWALRLARLCRKYEILPIVIFDSPQTTPAKVKERVKRSERQEHDRSRLQTSQVKADRLKNLSNTIKAIGNLSESQQEVVRKNFAIARKTTTEQVSEQNAATSAEQIDSMVTQVDGQSDPKDIPVEVSVTISEVDALTTTKQTTALVKKLLAHLKQVLATNSHDSAAELALLVKLLKDGSSSHISELQDLQHQTADLIEKLSRRVIFPLFKDIKKTIGHLNSFGIPAHLSPDRFEGECTASYYVRKGIADCVATDDSDVLVYGVPQLRGFMSVHSPAGGHLHMLGDMKMVDPSIMRSGIALKSSEPWSESTFLDFAILCGTDFTEGIANFGINKTHSVMDESRTLDASVRSIEDFVLKTGAQKGKQRYHKHDHFESDAAIARAVFTSFPADHSLPSRLTRRGRKTFQKFIRMCKDTEEWNSRETAILNRARLRPDDLQVLENPLLYEPRSTHVAKTLDTIIAQANFNDNPDRQAADDSAFVYPNTA